MVVGWLENAWILPGSRPIFQHPTFEWHSAWEWPKSSKIPVTCVYVYTLYMYICIYIVCVYICMYTNICIYIHCVYIYIYICIALYVCTHYIYIYTLVIIPIMYPHLLISHIFYIALSQCHVSHIAVALRSACSAPFEARARCRPVSPGLPWVVTGKCEVFRFQMGESMGLTSANVQLSGFNML